MPAAAPSAPVQPPRLVALRQDPPELPRNLQNTGVQGSVRVGFSVNLDGSTADIRVLSSTNARLNDAAVKAVGKWLFQPIETQGLAEIDFVFEAR
jgi:TonB family protein